MANALQKQIEDAQIEGWNIDTETDDRAVMVKHNYGTLGAHVLVALLTIWWTLGLGNVCYAAYKYFGDTDKKVLRIDD
jgi:hypothetical protein